MKKTIKEKDIQLVEIFLCSDVQGHVGVDKNPNLFLMM